MIVYYSEERPIAIVYEENNRFKSIVEVIKNYVYILGVEIAKDGVSYSYKYANPLPPNGKSVSEWISSLDQKFVILLVVGNANLNAILTDIEANVVDNIHKYVLLENEDFNYFNSPPALSGFSFGLDIVTVYDHSKAVTEIYDLNNVTQKENAVKIVKLYNNNNLFVMFIYFIDVLYLKYYIIPSVEVNHPQQRVYYMQ